MSRPIGLHVNRFDELIENGYFYIDKTLVIKEWWEDGSTLNFITRPHCFGVSVNMSMIECFFSNRYMGRRDLFEGLAIWNEEKFRKLQGKYPVIYLSFTNVTATTFQEAEKQFYQNIVDVYKQYESIRTEKSFPVIYRSFFDSVISGDFEEIYKTSLIWMLMIILCFVYDQKVIVLIEAYDTPLQTSYEWGYGSEMASLVRSCFACLKDEKYLDRGIIMGTSDVCAPMTGRFQLSFSITDMLNMNVIRPTYNRYVSYFGFMEEEVLEALREYNLEDKKEEVAFWYNGIRFGEIGNIYNPYSIVHFLANRRSGNYLSNDRMNRFFEMILDEENDNYKLEDTMKQLLAGNNIRCEIEDEVVYAYLHKNQDAILNYLMQNGYLKIVNYDENDGDKYSWQLQYELAVANNEMRALLQEVFK